MCVFTVENTLQRDSVAPGFLTLPSCVISRVRECPLAWQPPSHPQLSGSPGFRALKRCLFAPLGTLDVSLGCFFFFLSEVLSMWQDTMFEPVSNVSLLSGPSFKTVQQNKVHFIYIQKKMMKTALNIAIKSGRVGGRGGTNFRPAAIGKRWQKVTDSWCSWLSFLYLEQGFGFPYV